MTVAAGPFLIAATLLVLGGALKARHPIDTAIALRGVGVPAGPNLVRAGAVAETAIGIWAVVVGDRASAVCVVLSYGVFAVFIAVALLRRVPIASCGCFGKADTPPSLVHLGINAGAITAAVAVAFDPGVGLADVLAEQPLAGVPMLLLIGTGVFLVVVAMSSLPRTLAAARW